MAARPWVSRPPRVSAIHGAVDSLPRLPLTREQLPEALQRFGDPAAPEKARTMASRGLVPLKGHDLVALLLQLAADPVRAIADGAAATLDGLPPGSLAAAAAAPLHPSFLDALADRASTDHETLEALASNHQTSDATIARMARMGSELLCEVIATNQERLLAAPVIIEALYKNRNARMSTVDRLVELCARRGVELEGVHTFKAHVDAISGQLIPEPDDEPLPADTAFNEVLAHDDDEDAVEADKVEGTEAIKEKYLPLSMLVAKMNLQEKLRLTLVGNAAARALLVRDSNRMVSMAAISSPMVTESEATGLANSRQVSEDILRYIGNKRDWLGNYEIKRALVFNPKCPVGISMKFLPHLHVGDLRTLSRGRGVPAALKTAAQQRVSKKGG